MAENEAPVYFDRNLDAVLGSRISDLARATDGISIVRRELPELGRDTLDAIDEAVVALSKRLAEKRIENRARPVQIDRRERPELVVHFGRRYDVTLDDRTLSDVELSRSTSSWQYRSGRNVYLYAKRIVAIYERSAVSE